MCSSLCVGQSILSTGHHHLRFLVTTKKLPKLTREAPQAAKSTTFSWVKHPTILRKDSLTRLKQNILTYFLESLLKAVYQSISGPFRDKWVFWRYALLLLYFPKTNNVQDEKVIMPTAKAAGALQQKGMTLLAKKDSATLETQSSISEAAHPPFFGAQKRTMAMTIHIATTDYDSRNVRICQKQVT